MDTIDAVAGMAAAQEAGRDAARTSYATALNRRAPGLASVAARLLETTAAHRLDPAYDGATQTRVAAAVERAATRISDGTDPLDATRSAHVDFSLQEAAALRLPQKGGVDPYATMISAQSSRGGYNPASILQERHGIAVHALFDRTPLHDMKAIASGQLGDIADDSVRAAVAIAVSVPADRLGVAASPRVASVEAAAYPSSGIARGPEPAPMPISTFGRKGVGR